MVFGRYFSTQAAIEKVPQISPELSARVLGWRLTLLGGVDEVSSLSTHRRWHGQFCGRHVERIVVDSEDLCRQLLRLPIVEMSIIRAQKTRPPSLPHFRPPARLSPPLCDARMKASPGGASKVARRWTSTANDVYGRRALDVRKRNPLTRLTSYMMIHITVATVLRAPSIQALQDVIASSPSFIFTRRSDNSQHPAASHLSDPWNVSLPGVPGSDK